MGQRVAFVDQIVPESEDAANNRSVLRHFEIRLQFLHPRAWMKKSCMDFC